jgi:hypothetical protein
LFCTWMICKLRLDLRSLISGESLSLRKNHFGGYVSVVC